MNKTEMLTPEKETESVGEMLYKDFSVPGHLKDATPLLLYRDSPADSKAQSAHPVLLSRFPQPHEGSNPARSRNY